MESLRYICWMFCLVQIATVKGRPDFGTSFQFSASSTIGRISGEISSLFATIDDTLNFMISGAIPDSAMKRELMAAFTEDFSISAKAITDLLQEAASSTSSMDTTLSTVRTAYNNFTTYYNANANSFLQSTSQSFGNYLTTELYSGLEHFMQGISPLSTALGMLQTSLESASVAEDVPSERFRMLVRALRLLKAHVLLMVYSFQRVGVNLQTADTFYATFKQHQQQLPAEFIAETVAFSAELSTMEEAVEAKLSGVEESFNYTVTQIETELTGDVQNQVGFMQFQTALKTFASLRSSFVKNLKESIVVGSTAYRASVAALVSQTFYFDSSVPLDSAALDLVTLLIQSNVFDKVCYNKFAALVADLPTLGPIRLAECLNTEVPRLRKLEAMIETYGLMVSYDDKDLWHNLRPCRSEFAASSCISEVGVFYPRLEAARDDDGETWAGNFFTAALSASLHRIGLCFLKTNFFTFQRQVPTFKRNIASCFSGL
uniref:Uncharacterized protein n=1 Tax=Anopheles stephensi TaxID=30069 RepID=A0A182XYH3_ANOST